MTVVLSIHSVNPQAHLVQQAATVLRNNGIIVYPTDSGYALACKLGNKVGLERMRLIRQLNKKHHFTLVCSNLTEITQYAKLNDFNYRLLRAYTPGPYTFILPAARELSRYLLHSAQKTVGLRIPDHQIALALIEMLDHPLLSTTLSIPGKEINFLEAQTINDILGHQIDLIIDAGSCGLMPTTVVDLSKEKPIILRQGNGDPEPFL